MKLSSGLRRRRAMASVVGALIFFLMLFTVGTGYFLFVNTENQQYSAGLAARSNAIQSASSENLQITTMALSSNGDVGFYVNSTSGLNVNVSAVLVVSATGSILQCTGKGLSSGFCSHQSSHFEVCTSTSCTGTVTPAPSFIVVNSGQGSNVVDTGYNYVAGTTDTVKVLTQRGNVYSATYPPTANQNSVMANTAQSLTVDPSTFKWEAIQPNSASLVQKGYSSNCANINCGLGYGSPVAAGNTLIFGLGWYNLNPPATPIDTRGSSFILGANNSVTYTYTPAYVGSHFNPNCGSATCGTTYNVVSSGNTLVFGLGWYNQSPPTALPSDTFGDSFTLGANNLVTVNPPSPSLVQENYLANCANRNCGLAYGSPVTAGNTLVYGLGWYGSLPYVPVTVADCPSQVSSVTLVQHGPAAYRSSSTTLPVTLVSNVASGDLVVLMFNDQSNRGVSSVTGFGVSTWSLAVSETPASGGVAYMYYGLSSGGSASATVTFGGTDISAGSAAEFSGISTPVTLDGTNTNSGRSTSPSTGSVTTTNANDLLMAVELDNGGNGVSAATNGFTNLDSQNSNYQYADAYDTVASTGSYSTGWTISSATWGGMIAAFKASSASSCVSHIFVDSNADNECDGASTCTITNFSTPNPDDLIYFSITDSAGGLSVSSVSDTAGLTWIARGSSTSSGNQDVFTYYAIAPSALSGDTISATLSGSGNLRFMVIGVSGANLVTPFDPNLPYPAPQNTGSSSTVTITFSTTNANDLIIGTTKSGSNNINSGASGYTSIICCNSLYAGLEYKVVSSAGSQTPSFSLAGSGNWGEVGDAIQATPQAATPTTFQQMVTWNPSAFSSYESSDLGNIRFCADAACATQLNAWLESCTSSCTTSATSATAWVKLISSISYGGSATIYMVFYPLSADFDGNYWGEAPNLSSPYGHFDNGANVFTAYFNGNTATSSFSVASGYTLVQATGVTYGSGTISALKLTGYGSGTAPLVFSSQMSNAAMIGESNFENTNHATDSGVAGFVDNSVAGSVQNAISTNSGWQNAYFNLDYKSGGTTTSGVSNQGTASTAWLYGSVSYAGSTGGSFSGSVAPQLYSTSGGYGGGANANPISAAAHLYLGFVYTTNSGAQANMLYNWDRARVFPPNGVMPTATFGSVTGGNPLTGPTDSLGDTFSLGPSSWIVSGSSTYYSYIWYTTAKSSQPDTITATFVSSVTGTISIYELAGYTTAGEQSSIGSNYGSSSLSVSPFTPTSNSFVIGNAETASGSSTFTAGSGYTLVQGSGTPSTCNSVYGCSEYLSGSNGQRTVQMTIGASAAWVESAISFPLATAVTYYSYIWYATAGNSGTDTISVQFQQTVQGTVSVYEFSGLTTTAVQPVPSTGGSITAGSSSSVNPSINPPLAGSVVVGNVEASSTTFTAGSPYTLIPGTGNCNSVYGCSEYATGVSSATAVPMSFNPGSPWVEAALAFAPKQTTYYSYIWYATAGASGTDTVTASFSQTAQGSVSIYEIAGYMVSGIRTSTGSSSTASSPATVTSFTPGGSSFVVGNTEAATTSYTASAGYALPLGTGSCNSVNGCSEYQSGVSSATTASMTLNPTATWVEAAVAFPGAPALQSGALVGGYPAAGLPTGTSLSWQVQFTNQDAKGRAVTLWPKSLAAIETIMAETVEVTPFFIIDGVSTDGTTLIAYNSTQDFITIPYKATVTVYFGATTPLGTGTDNVDNTEIAPFTGFFALEGQYSDGTLFGLTVPYPAGMVTQANVQESPTAGATTTTVTVSCTSPCHFNANARAYVGWLDSTGKLTVMKTFTMSGSGNIPSGITFTVPSASVGYYTVMVSDYVNTVYMTFHHT